MHLKNGTMKFKNEIKIEGKVISNISPTFIIAEAGVNHGGDMQKARDLIDLAVKAGADAVKFQTFKADQLILKSVKKAPYQTKTTSKTESQYDMLKRLEVTKQQNTELLAYAKKKGIIFLTTPFDEESLKELIELEIPAYKIASTDLTNIPFLVQIAKTGKPIFLSTGMSYLSEVTIALENILPYNQEVVLMQCTANYPIEDYEANLNILNTYKNQFNILLGYSDHTVGIGAAPFAVPMGAVLVEKHFTLSKNDEGPDHKASLSPNELIDFIRLIRQVDTYMGSYHKIPTLSEMQTRASLQKCLVAKCKIKKGDFFSAENIIAKRTGGIGLSAIYLNSIIGKAAMHEFGENEIIKI